VHVLCSRSSLLYGYKCEEPAVGYGGNDSAKPIWNCCRDGTAMRATWINPDRMHIEFAGVVELAVTRRSGRRARKGVKVRVLSPAPDLREQPGWPEAGALKALGSNPFVSSNLTSRTNFAQVKGTLAYLSDRESDVCGFKSHSAHQDCPSGQTGEGASLKPKRFCGFESHLGHQALEDTLSRLTRS
jgi:hypothetical protein